MIRFAKSTDGVVTVEWVGIAAVMVLAAIGITAFTMQGADAAGNTVSTGLRSVDASGPSMGGAFGNGSAN